MSSQGLFALHRSWQKFDELQHEWHSQAKELASKNKLLEADAAFVKISLVEKEKFKEKVESSRKAASEATKEVKEIKEYLQTCRLDRDYHKDLVEKKTALVDNLQNDLQTQTEQCGKMSAENIQLKEARQKLLEDHAEEKKKLLDNHAGELEDYKDVVDICFFMFWKHNRGADFSYLGDAYAAEEAKCLKCLAEEESDAAAGGPQDHQDPEA